MKHRLKTLEELSDESISAMTGVELDAYIAKHLLGYRDLERSIIGGSYHGIVGDEGVRYPAPECTSSASAVFGALNTAIDVLPFLGDVFIEYWGDGEWFVCNRPLGHRENAVCASCDGVMTGKHDIRLAVSRFLLKSIKRNWEIAHGQKSL